MVSLYFNLSLGEQVRNTPQANLFILELLIVKGVVFQNRRVSLRVRTGIGFEEIYWVI